MAEYAPTDRTAPHRLAERVSYDQDLVHSILDEALICHVGVDASGPLVLPMIHARVGETLYLHMSTGSGLALTAPVDVCLTASIVDGLVMAKSQFNHSMNYRCVVVRGRAELVTDSDERLLAMAAIVDHVAPGRSAESRPPNSRELAATRILRLALGEVSAKVRSGAVHDDDGDLDLPYWAGVVPIRLTAGRPKPEPNADGLPPRGRG